MMMMTSRVILPFFLSFFLSQNHSCSPSLYTKILAIDGELRLAFFAKSDIHPGQELTYNYRFKPETGEERIVCLCGAPNCTGYLDEEEEEN